MATEIFGTFGPSCKTKKIIEQMMDAGMTGMRFNLSHMTLAESGDCIKVYQEVAQEKGVKPQILIDMQGPELRVGELRERIVLQEKDVVIFCAIEEYAQWIVTGAICIPVPAEVMGVLETGDEVILDDGKMSIRILEGDPVYRRRGALEGKVLRAGNLQSHKSIKIIGKNVALPPLTTLDIENLKEAKAHGVTALMQPFVLRGEDLRYVRQVLKENDAEEISIFAKIENMEGVRNIEGILPEADVIVIARGDLGNDMPLWELPKVQKQIEKACKKANKPYIVVTQMLASMEENPVPTRAEVSDIFHAVYHGAWGVMVTGETAVGKYPVEVIRYLANTSQVAEKK